MTEHELDRIALEACGYKHLCAVDKQADIYEHADGTQILSDLAPWSSADAAIAHVELGGFVVFRIHEHQNDPDRWHVDIVKDDCRADGYANKLGPAIRNAILEWKDKNP